MHSKHNFAANLLKSLTIHYDPKKYPRKKLDKKRHCKQIKSPQSKHLEHFNLNKLQLFFITILLMLFGSFCDYKFESHPLNASQVRQSPYYQHNVYPIFIQKQELYPRRQMKQYANHIPIYIDDEHVYNSIESKTDSSEGPALDTKQINVPEIPSMFQINAQIDQQNIDYVGSEFIHRYRFMIEHIQLITITPPINLDTNDIFVILIICSIFGTIFCCNQCYRCSCSTRDKRKKCFYCIGVSLLIWMSLTVLIFYFIDIDQFDNSFVFEQIN